MAAPTADRAPLPQLLAEHETEAISKRTIAALATAKRRATILSGFKGRHLTAAERAQGTAVRVAKAKARAFCTVHAREMGPLTGYARRLLEALHIRSAHWTKND